VHLANAVLGYTPPEAKKFVEIVVVKLLKKTYDKPSKYHCIN